MFSKNSHANRLQGRRHHKIGRMTIKDRFECGVRIVEKDRRIGSDTRVTETL